MGDKSLGPFIADLPECGPVLTELKARVAPLFHQHVGPGVRADGDSAETYLCETLPGCIVILVVEVQFFGPRSCPLFAVEP